MFHTEECMIRRKNQFLCVKSPRDVSRRSRTSTFPYRSLLIPTEYSKFSSTQTFETWRMFPWCLNGRMWHQCQLRERNRRKLTLLVSPLIVKNFKCHWWNRKSHDEGQKLVQWKKNGRKIVQNSRLCRAQLFELKLYILLPLDVNDGIRNFSSREQTKQKFSFWAGHAELIDERRSEIDDKITVW